MTLLRRGLYALVILVALAYAGAIAYMYFNQRALQYSPAGEIIPLSATTLTDAEEVKIPSGNASVTAWYKAPPPGRPVIIFYKGNTGSFTEEHQRYEQFVADGFGFAAFDYRGFPTSPGEISQDNMLEDSLAVFDWVAAKGAPIMIWGRSIGTGPATYVAANRDAEALLLETPYLSAVTVAADRYPILPVGLVMMDKFPSNEWIRDVSEPLLIAHGTADATIGVSNGERLYALAPNPSELWIVPDADHSDLWAAGIWGQAKPFFEKALIP
ncbi:alpha/beta hydrolase [Devosia sp. SD17-2]|uniref:alpha/beta hydrolase n=1 Tax=Devosia sp. SD17-2 TaxID=2976459 RepID=UPI0023D7CB2C|nr:alpha/beta hydrolase [Devosia sp. SD17-2]WEJ32874.1 alpha/beta hydrolase [Devosia sp. SD17-2]